MCLFCGLVTLLMVGCVYPPLNMDHRRAYKAENENEYGYMRGEWVDVRWMYVVRKTQP
jgi:hypothetical protein